MRRGQQETRVVRHMVHEGAMAHQAGRGITKPRYAPDFYENYERQTEDWEIEEAEVVYEVLPRQAQRQSQDWDPTAINNAGIEIAVLNKFKREALPALLEPLLARIHEAVQDAFIEEVEAAIDGRIAHLSDIIDQGG